MKAVLLIFIVTFAERSFAQIDLPDLSPAGALKQTVGYTQFEITYSRPAARKRKIMGGLVPYGRLWRTGAGKCSTISFDRDVMINNKTVPAGAYAFVTIPNEHEWVVLLNGDTTRLYGDPSEYDVATEAVRLTVKPEKTDRFYESLTIELDIVKYDAVLYLAWENTQIHFPIATGAHKQALASIGSTLHRNPGDPEVLAQASFYYTMNNEDPAQVLQWLDKAISLGGDRWVHHQKVDMLVTLGRYGQARKAANDAIAYLQRTKPVEWDGEVEILRNKLKTWPGK